MSTSLYLQFPKKYPCSVQKLLSCFSFCGLDFQVISTQIVFLITVHR